MPIRSKHSPFPLALAFLIACAPESAETNEDVALGSTVQEFRTGWHGAGHAEITVGGLKFLRESLRNDLAKENESVDGAALCDEVSHIDWFLPECKYTKLRSEYHVDNCRVGDAFQSLRARYLTLVESLGPDAPDFAHAVHRFGSILHTTQDFYAHSNWVDTGRTALIEERGFLHPEVGPGSLVGDLVLLAEPLPAGWLVQRDIGSRVPKVWDGTSWREGLITGTYAKNEDAPICPAAASIPHGDPFYQDGDGSYLAKDDPDSFHHSQAVKIATRQTTEEFCRLVRLVTLRHGQPARERLLTEWVADRTGYQVACPDDLSIVAGVVMAAL